MDDDAAGEDEAATGDYAAVSDDDTGRVRPRGSRDTIDPDNAYRFDDDEEEPEEEDSVFADALREDDAGDGDDAPDEPSDETDATSGFWDDDTVSVPRRDTTAESSDSLDYGAYDDYDDEPVVGGLRDNLKRINGIGPAIEKTLNELGIFRYRQIADMTDYDIDRVAKRLKGFRSRIHREDWMGQARELLDEAAGETA